MNVTENDLTTWKIKEAAVHLKYQKSVERIAEYQILVDEGASVVNGWRRRLGAGNRRRRKRRYIQTSAQFK